MPKFTPHQRLEDTSIFSFLLLPAELRELVYDHYIASGMIWVRRRMSLRMDIGEEPDETLSTVFRLLRLNRQIRHEALRYLFSRKAVLVEQHRLPDLYDVLPFQARDALTAIEITQYYPFYLWHKVHEQPNYPIPIHRCWRFPLTREFPALRSVGVRFLIGRNCLAFACGSPRCLPNMPNLSWPVKSEWFMESPGVKWLRGNRGLQLLEFRVIGGATRACSNCWETNKDKSEQMLEDVQRKICAEVEEVEQ